VPGADPALDRCRCASGLSPGTPRDAGRRAQAGASVTVVLLCPRVITIRTDSLPWVAV